MRLNRRTRGEEEEEEQEEEEARRSTELLSSGSLARHATRQYVTRHVSTVRIPGWPAPHKNEGLGAGTRTWAPRRQDAAAHARAATA